MINTFGRIAAGIAVAAGLIVGASSPALASSSSGAYVGNSPLTCTAYGSITVCSQDHTNSNYVFTPSGNYVNQTNSKYYFSISDSSSGFVYYSDSGTYRGVDTNQQSHDAYMDTYTYSGQSCTMGQRYHYANGQIQFDRPYNTCY